MPCCAALCCAMSCRLKPEHVVVMMSRSANLLLTLLTGPILAAAGDYGSGDQQVGASTVCMGISLLSCCTPTQQ